MTLSRCQCSLIMRMYLLPETDSGLVAAVIRGRIREVPIVSSAAPTTIIANRITMTRFCLFVKT